MKILKYVPHQPIDRENKCKIDTVCLHAPPHGQRRIYPSKVEMRNGSAYFENYPNIPEDPKTQGSSSVEEPIVSEECSDSRYLLDGNEGRLRTCIPGGSSRLRILTYVLDKPTGREEKGKI